MRSTVCVGVLALGLGLTSVTGVPGQTTKPASRPATAAASQPAAASRLGVPASAREAEPLKAGDSLPEVHSLKDATGADFDLADAVQGKTAVIVFYRGGWCPYCNTHLADLARVHPRLKAAGVELIGISPDSPETLSGSLAEKPLPYTVVSDSSHVAMKAFGVAYGVDEGTQAKLKEYDIDILAASSNPDPVLPVPSVFVVNETGRVTYAYANPDYKTRLSGEEVLAAAKIK